MERDPSRASYAAEVQVRWSDCDPAGVVYYPNYFTLFESALFAFMEERGATWPALMRDHGVRFPRFEARCRYVGPATVGDRLLVRLRVTEARAKGLTVGFSIEHADGQRPVADGQVTFVALLVDAEAGTGAVDLPPALLELFAPLMPDPASAEQ